MRNKRSQPASASSSWCSCIPYSKRHRATEHVNHRREFTVIE